MGRQKIVRCSTDDFEHDLRIKADSIKKIPLPLGTDDDKILIVLYCVKEKNNQGYKLRTIAFTIIYAILYKEKWLNVRKHCWMLHSKAFHTHIKLGLGKRNKKTIHQPWISPIGKALEWSKKDMKTYWYVYKNKLLKELKKG